MVRERRRENKTGIQGILPFGRIPPGLWFAAGLAAILIMYLPMLILGEGSIVTYHDQLDGELIAYILQARHLLDGAVLPEFMGGVAKTALTPPAPAFVLWFVILPPFVAYLCMQLLGSITAYVGMYLLTGEVSEHPPVRALVSVMFAGLPFLPVYGLSQFGIPLLVWCMIRLWRGEKPYRSWIYCAVYAFHSSLVLVGFAVLGLWLAVWLVSLRKREKTGQRGLLAGFAIMLLVYVGENASLLGQLLGGGWVSHKAEYRLTASSFWPGFWEALALGGQHSGDYHRFWLAGAGLLVLLVLWELRRDRSWEKLRIPVIMGICILLAFATALWKSPAGLALRTHLAALGAFQLERVLWVSPCLWYLLLAALLERGWRESRAGGTTCRGRMAWRGGMALLVAGICVSGGAILKESSFRHNLTRLVKPDYKMLTYEEYYAVGVMDQVRIFLEEYTGEDCREFRVVSLGIDPAAALYEGFYCLDGYSNNYPLSYKHDFRRIIAPELEKSEYLREYFDGWGNRCYLLSSESPAYYTIEKGGFFFRELELDTRALADMGGQFVLSAAYIADSEEIGLSLLREEPFATGDSYYQIFVYEVKE